MKVIAGLLLALGLGTSLALAQKPEFEVASVKKTEIGPLPGDMVRNMAESPGHFAMKNVPIRYILQWAYDLKDYQLEGPGWINGEVRYDIFATAPGSTDDQMRVMLQTLVDQRFQMKSHWETRETQVYVLVRGKGEVKLKPSQDVPSLGNKNGLTVFHGQPVSRFTFLLTRRMAKPVLDETGLTGAYDFGLDLSGLGFNGNPPAENTGPSVFTSVQEDLGLKLEPAKRSLKILVVDSADKTPAAN